jgi:hypothetical protein
MAGLFVRVVAYLVVAFALGVGVATMFWRWGRRPVPTDEWRDTQAEVARLRRQVQALHTRLSDGSPRAVAAGDADAEAAERENARSPLVASEREREQLRRQLAEARAEAVAALGDLRQSEAYVLFLQRRLTELAVLAEGTGFSPPTIDLGAPPPALPAPLGLPPAGNGHARSTA